jgi:transcriptional regulator with PAS, ATPase and Fis domain
MIQLVGETDSMLLITGESGTGKELVAEEIHAVSKRADKPLIKVNCAALPETLLVSELFGYSKGSFTGAVKDSYGLFKAADGGTLFLDEIGDMSADAQSKLLHVLERKEFHRIGDTSPIKIDVRIITATNQQLPYRIQQGLFREDLYYRLNVIQIKMPPLRDRTEDIPALVKHFLGRLNTKLKKNIQAVSDEVLACFMSYTWPGNIRELSHTLEHACIMCRSNVIDMHQLPPGLQNTMNFSELLPENSVMPQADMLKNVLIKTGGNKARAARILGINRKTLYRNLKKYHITSDRQQIK